MFKCTGQNVMAMSYALSTYLIQNYNIDELSYISNVLLLLGQQIQTAIEEEAFCQALSKGNGRAEIIAEEEIV